MYTTVSQYVALFKSTGTVVVELYEYYCNEKEYDTVRNVSISWFFYQG